MHKINTMLVGLLGLMLVSGAALAAEETTSKRKWEFGLGLATLSVPHYRGSDQRKLYLAPLPYIRFRGERLKVDREGGRYYFFNQKNLKLDISAAVSLPLDSDDNRARQGMPDLDALLEAGPRLQWFMYQSDDDRFRVRLAAPLRLAVNLSDAGNEGWVFAPYLQVRYYSIMETAFSLGPMWASEKYHDYFYQVDSQYATVNRPAYNAEAGYSGFRFTLTNSHRLSKHYWWGGFIRYDTLSGAKFENSPLVKRNNDVVAGLVFSYIFNPVKEYYQSPVFN